MASALYLILAPTLCIFIILTKTTNWRSPLCRLVIAFFSGQFALTHITYLLALCMTYCSGQVLADVAVIDIVVATLTLLFVVYFYRFKLDLRYADLGVVFLFLLVSQVLFHNHLKLTADGIYRSEVFWDFAITMSKVNSFSFGNNFPALNPIYSNIPFAYHFFPDVLIALYQSCGLDLVSAINLFSMCMLGFTLSGLVGISEELFCTRSAGFIASLLALTSGSLRFIDDLRNNWDQPLTELVSNLLSNTSHPYYFALQQQQHGYNGNMFNIFYLLQERHLLPGCLLILIAFLFFSRPSSFGRVQALVAGAILGLSMRWGMGAFICVWSVCVGVAALSRARTLFIILLVSAPFILLYVLDFSRLGETADYLSISREMPRLNFSFAGLYQIPSLGEWILYWIYSYGLKLPLFIAGIVLLWKTDWGSGKAALVFFVITLVFVNTLQFFPISVYDNHKLLRPANFIVDLVVGLTLSRLFRLRSWHKAAAVLLLVLCTLGGAIELVPFLRSMPNVNAISASQTEIESIRAKISPRSVFLTYHPNVILYAGRQLYYLDSARAEGNNISYDYVLDKRRRERITRVIYAAASIHRLCSLLQTERIDYVEVPTVQSYSQSLRTVSFKIGGKALTFVDREQTCVSP